MVGRLTDSFSHPIKTVHLRSQNPARDASATTRPDGAALFVDDHKFYTTVLADDVIEVKVQPVVNSMVRSAAQVGSCAGVVAQIGTHVESLIPDD